MKPISTKTSVKVWDIYLRLFHWMLAIAVTVSFISVEFDAMQIHTTSGICVVGLLIFRLIWGIAGSTTAQFRHFVRGPKAVLAYLANLKSSTSGPNNSNFYHTEDPASEGPAPHPGHTPLGALSVIAMLGALLTQAGSGMFADDEVFTTGPLAQFVSSDFSESATSLHGMNAWFILFLIFMHLCAIAWYLFVQKNNLIIPMLSGYKSFAPGQAAAYGYLRMGGVFVALFAIALALAVGLWLYTL